MNALKIILGIIAAFSLSFVISFYGYLTYLKLSPMHTCEVDCAVVWGITVSYYVPILTFVLVVPIYLMVRKLFKVY